MLGNGRLRSLEPDVVLGQERPHAGPTSVEVRAWGSLTRSRSPRRSAVGQGEVQNMLGHASAAMTLDVYAGLFEDDVTALADRIDNAGADSLRTAGTVVDHPSSQAFDLAFCCRPHGNRTRNPRIRASLPRFR